MISMPMIKHQKPVALSQLYRRLTESATGIAGETKSPDLVDRMRRLVTRYNRIARELEAKGL